MQLQHRHHPHGWCGLKYKNNCEKKRERQESPPTRVVWIEIKLDKDVFQKALSHHPHGWCGLKFCTISWFCLATMSPPTRVVWIEIPHGGGYDGSKYTSPPTRVVWIEIL